MIIEDKYMKTVSAKLSRKDFVLFKNYCDRKGVKVSSQLKQMVDRELDSSLSVSAAGKNFFSYNKAKDVFTWNIELDEGDVSCFEDNLSPEFLSQLRKAIDAATEERDTFIHKKKRDSVSIPVKMMRKRP